MPKLKHFVLALGIWWAGAGLAAALPEPAINLDAQAQNLPLGDLIAWPNLGTVPDSRFDARGTPPIVGLVAGRRAVSFNGMNGFRANFLMPAEFTGNQAWTVSYWVYNPSIQRAERIFGWTPTWASADRTAAFGYGSDPAFGAAFHGGGGGIGFDRGVPASNAWHNITIAYSGASGWEKVWVDGALNAIEQRPGTHSLNLESGGPVWIGCTDDPSASFNFSGSLASLRVYAAEATWAEVQTLAGTAAPAPGEAPRMVNADFELGDPGEGRIIAGWAPTELWNPGSPARTGIAVWGRNRGTGGPWTNGIDSAGGNRVLAISGATSGTRTAGQWLNLRGGRKYHVALYINAAAGGQPVIGARVNGIPIGTPYIMDPIEPAGVFQHRFREWWTGDYTYTAPADGAYLLEIEQSKPGAQHVILVDHVAVLDKSTSTPLQGPALVDFGQVAAGGIVDCTLTVRNVGGDSVDWWTTTYGGPDAARFRVWGETQPQGAGHSRVPVGFGPYGGTQDIQLRFTAGAQARTYHGTVGLNWNDGSRDGVTTFTLVARVPAASAPVLTNGGFEQPFAIYQDPWHTLAYGKALGDNQAIEGWSAAPQEGIGVADAGHALFIGSAPPEGRQTLWIQTRPGIYETTRTVSQRIAGWNGAKTYVIGLWASGSDQGSSAGILPAFALQAGSLPGSSAGILPAFALQAGSLRYEGMPGGAVGLSLRVGGRTLAARCGQGGTAIPTGEVTTITATGGRTWHHLLYDFRPPGGVGGQYDLELAATALSGEKVLLIDNVRIYEAGSPPAGSCPQLSAGPLQFTGTQGLNSEPTTVTFFNEGGTTLTLGNFQIVGTNGSQFKTENTTHTVAPYGGSCSHSVMMRARELGGIGSASLQCSSNDTTGTWQVPLYGYSVNYGVFNNGSFEQPVAYWANDGTWRCQGQGIPGGIPRLQLWVPPGSDDPSEYFGIGIRMTTDIANSQWNNGAPGNGDQVGWLRVGPADDPDPGLRAPKALRQRVYGFYPSFLYCLVIYVNARAVGDNMVEWGVRYGPDENSLIDMCLYDTTAVAELSDFTKPFQMIRAPFNTITGNNLRRDGSILFEIYVPNQVDDSTLLIDAVEIYGPPPWPGDNAVKKEWTKYE